MRTTPTEPPASSNLGWVYRGRRPYTRESTQHGVLPCLAGGEGLGRAMILQWWAGRTARLDVLNRIACPHCKGRWQHGKPKLNAHLHGSYLSNTKLKFSFYWIWRHQSKPGALSLFEAGGINRKKVSKLIKNLLMPALARHFQLMPAQRMGDHFFFCFYQLKLALIYYPRQAHWFRI